MTTLWPDPAYAIHTPRLTLRCYERGDVAAVHEAVLANMDALRPWMGEWIAAEPAALADRIKTLRSFRARFDLGTDFFYGIFDRGDERYLGGTGLHPRLPGGAIEIGYWIVSDRWGEGLATEVASALTRVAFERIEVPRVEIRVSPRNARSLAVPRKLGYREEGTLRRVAPMAGGGHDDLVIFGMLPGELETSPAREVSISIEGFAKS